MDILEGVHGRVGDDPSPDMKGSYDESGRGICGGSKIEELRECVDLIDGWYARRGVGRILSLVGELGLSLVMGLLLLLLFLLEERLNMWCGEARKKRRLWETDQVFFFPQGV